jgi:hypothetical protein
MRHRRFDNCMNLQKNIEQTKANHKKYRRYLHKIYLSEIFDLQPISWGTAQQTMLLAHAGSLVSTCPKYYYFVQYHRLGNE